MSEHLHPDPDTLSAFVEGVLPEHERAQCLAHLAECSRCREIVFLAQDTPAPPVVVPITVRPRRVRPMPLLAAAASVCFAVLGSWFYLRSKIEAPPQERADQATAAPQAAEKPAEVEKPKTVARASAPPVAPPRSPEPVPQAPVPSPVAAPEVARAAPSPATEEKAQVTVSPSLAAPSRIMQVAPVETVSGISGTVTDPSGAVVPQASVEVRLVGGLTASNAQTDEGGKFKFSGLAPGRYELRITRAGFRSASQQVELHAQEVAEVKSTLQVGSAASTVEVMAAASTLQAENSSMSRSRRKQAAPPQPRPLPSKLPAETTVTHEKVMLAVDSAGVLFVSGNSGKSWKAVKPQWAGKITDLVAPPDVPEPGSAQFQLTTDSGAEWLSRDGRRWFPAAPQH